ncbi:MAG: N-acetylneuraminate synthase family protein [Candidatus Pacebacteria bacterium]|nr:N-acetylneuraminate synthase family protein [Candidatus Paceibacterota bacterium]
MPQIKISDKLLGDNNPVFVIAEAASNHDGSLEQAKQLIDVAAESKADAVKFQLFRASMVYPPNCGKIPTLTGELDLYDFFRQMEVPYEWLSSLKKYAENKGLVFIVTPFDEETADELEKAGVSAYKIASPESNHIPLLRHIAKKNKPIIISTGLSKLRDIEESVETIQNQGNNDIVVLHCVSGYPTKEEDYNLNVIETLKRAFGTLVGVSDHSLNPVIVPMLATALGIDVIEKHFTLSRKLKGADHPISIEPDELRLMIEKIRETERLTDDKKKELLNRPECQKVLGLSQKVIADSEKELYPGDKRSIFSVKDIDKGEMLTKDNIRVLRAERYLKPGIHPRYFEMLLGKKASNPIKRYAGVLWEDILIK